MNLENGLRTGSIQDDMFGVELSSSPKMARVEPNP